MIREREGHGIRVRIPGPGCRVEGSGKKCITFPLMVNILLLLSLLPIQSNCPARRTMPLRQRLPLLCRMPLVFDRGMSAIISRSSSDSINTFAHSVQSSGNRVVMASLSFRDQRKAFPCLPLSLQQLLLFIQTSGPVPRHQSNSKGHVFMIENAKFTP